MNPWEQFKKVATGGSVDRVPVALIVDSPWLPSYAGIDTFDYFLLPEVWTRINLQLLTRFPDVAWIPGFWVEYGMAAEPSAFGAKVVWHHDRPPSIAPVRGGLVDGPVYERIFKSLKGVSITEPDPLAAFQSELAVYHDDVKDYSTNEPTMDGTASAILMFALCAARK